MAALGELKKCCGESRSIGAPILRAGRTLSTDICENSWRRGGSSKFPTALTGREENALWRRAGRSGEARRALPERRSVPVPAIALAAKFRKPLPIVLGILAATLLNHALAASAGFYVSAFLSGKPFQIAVGAAFIVMAHWALVPDQEDGKAAVKVRGGVFTATALAFFLSRSATRRRSRRLCLPRVFIKSPRSPRARPSA